MTIYRLIVLLGAGLGGGLAGTVASVASVASYPALLALGLPPLAANVTNTVSMIFSVPGSVLAARSELSGQLDRIVRFSAVMAAGGALGAAILLLAPPGAFGLVVPVLVGSASVLIVLQPRLRSLSPPPAAEQGSGEHSGTGQPGTEHSGTEHSGTGRPGTEHSGTGHSGTGQPGTGQPGTGQPGTGQPGTGQPGTGQPGTGQPGTGHSGTGRSGTGRSGTGRSGTGRSGTGRSGTGQPGTEQSGRRLAALFSVAIYLGYFGAAGGVLVFATLAATLSESLIRINAIKNVVAGAANLVAAALFALYAPVEWAFVPPLAVGFLLGGYAGQHLARHLPAGVLRAAVALAGLVLAVKLGLTAYR
jgi:uncharacterized membrane protein YfcA